MTSPLASNAWVVVAKQVGYATKGDCDSMLTDYINAAMARAVYENLEDGYFYGEISGIRGVYAHEQTLEEARRELQSALEDWIVFGLVSGFLIPEIGGIQISTTKVA